MKIALIHFSDMHIKPTDNPVFDRTENICQAIRNLTIEVEAVFWIITGDIAYSGLALEYRNAKRFIDGVKNRMDTYTQRNTHVIMVPGNHDCNFIIDKTEERQTTVKSVQENGDSCIDEGVITDCCEAQSPFFQLMHQYRDADNVVFSDKLVWITEYCVGAYNIVFNCFNTSWISEVKETPGKIHFPIKTYPAGHFRRQSNLNISVFHHTLNWFNPTNSRDFSGKIEDTSHIVFTGHEHVSTKSMKDNLEGTSTYFIEGAVLQDEERSETSGFNLLIADLSQDKHKIRQYTWNGEIYQPIHETAWLSYRGEKSTDKVAFPFDSSFENGFLDNVGAQIKHPTKTSVSLEDVFIFPHLRDLTSYTRKDSDFLRDVVESSVLCRIKEASYRILLVGGRNAGKTTLCKIISRHYHNNNYVPIYVEGGRIRTAGVDDFERLLKRCYSEQYSRDNVEEFTQLDNSNKVIIIDDFDKSRLNSKTRAILLHSIHKHYPKVVITGGDLLQIDDIFAGEGWMALVVDEYEQYLIMEFGHLLRSRLINRWNTLGKEEFIGEEELIRKHDEARQVFNTIIGKNYVPSYPVFLLIMLQSMEAGRPHELAESSFGHYYQYLMFDSLNKVIHKTDEIDAYYNFLTDFAYHLFIRRAYEISKDAFHAFHSQYCRDYAISPSFDELMNPSLLLNNLVIADIVEDQDGVYKFTYPYIFNFFVARYLSNELNDDSIRETVSNLCRRLYHEEFADIMMFLTHHSKDPFILDEILRNAKSLFEKCTPIRFEDDMTTANDLLGEIPRLVLEDRGIRKHREEQLQLQDAREFTDTSDISESDGEIPDIYEPLKQLDLMAELNMAFKIVQILGQILKNYSGSLMAPSKLLLGEEAYMLGLRALNPFFEVLEEKKENLVARIRHILGKENIVEQEDIEEASRLIVFTIYSTMSYSFIKMISTSVGSERLSPTFKEILYKHDTNSVSLIDMSIKLDYYRRFPYEDLRRVKQKVAHNVLPYRLLQEMVQDYLYMFPTTYKVKQRICQLVDIPIIHQMVIDGTSRQKKLLPPQ